MTFVLLVAFGLMLGSFVNALVWRFHEQDEVRWRLEEFRKSLATAKQDRRARLQSDIGKAEAELNELSMSKGRSMCSKCRHPLGPADLVPLFSWLWLRGRCRYCRQPIEDPPVIDAVLPLLFVISYLVWPISLDGWGYGWFAFLCWLVFLTGFVALTVYDMRWFLLPDRIVWPLVALALLQVGAHALFFDGGVAALTDALWGVAIASGVFLGLFVVAERLKREWIGFGDVKLGIILGLLVGGPLSAIILLYIASFLGLFFSLPMLLRHRLKRTSLIPFGPFLMIACIIVLLAEPALTGWLERFLLF
jgi:prepilin signal peptidase PulO-like enzyme (type II secretory pathway)